jgi:transposase
VAIDVTAVAPRTIIRCMAMGKRQRERQPSMWVATTDFATAASHPFYRRLNHQLREHGFDDFTESQCATLYADTERGIAWRAADSFALRDFLEVGLENTPPDHSTISRTRRLIDLEMHRAVFTPSGSGDGARCGAQHPVDLHLSSMKL